MDIDYDFHQYFVERGEWWEVITSSEDTGEAGVKLVSRYPIEDRADAVAHALCCRAELYRVARYWPSEQADDDLLFGPTTILEFAPPTEEEIVAWRGRQ